MVMYYISSSYSQKQGKIETESQFRGVLDILQKIHERGYVHCDIRPPNIIFDPDGLNSYLIDFDLARTVGYYPHGYYFSDTVRHEDARAGLAMEKVHDLHSLRLIIQHFFGVKRERATPKPKPIHVCINSTFDVCVCTCVYVCIHREA